jgi:hypothetical protein
MIAVRPTREGDLPGLDALFRASFGHPLSAAAWQWKYRALPGESRSMVAVDGAGTVLAHAGTVSLAARWRGGEGGIWQLVDFAGAAAGAGLRPPLVGLGRELLAGLPAAGDTPWMFGFPSARHFRLGARVFGYQLLTEIQPLAGTLHGLPPGDGGLAESSDSCGDWAAAAWEACGVLGVRRSATFLNWRYWARPERYYRFYRLASAAPGGAAGAHGPGLAVFAFVGEEAWAAELWLPPGGEWYPSLLAVAADLRAAGLSLWRFWPPPAASPGAPPGTFAPSPGSRLEEPGAILARLGLRPAGDPWLVACRSGPPGAPGAADPRAAAAGFYHAMGDYDLV